MTDKSQSLSKQLRRSCSYETITPQVRAMRADPTNDLVIDSADDLDAKDAEIAHLTFCLNSRDDFLGKINQWQAYVDTLPHRQAGVPGGWSSSPSSDCYALIVEAVKALELITDNGPGIYYINAEDMRTISSTLANLKAAMKDKDSDKPALPIERNTKSVL